MSRGNRWYTFSRVTPLADTAIMAIEPGAEYEVFGWSRTWEAAIAKRDKLNWAGRAGINVFSPSLQAAMADVMETYPVVVKGYISPANKRAGRQLVRAAVMRAIFCPYTGLVLDMRRAVVVDTGTRSFVMAAAHWDERKDQVLQIQAKAGRETKVYDGRELFKR